MSLPNASVPNPAQLPAHPPSHLPPTPPSEPVLEQQLKQVNLPTLQQMPLLLSNGPQLASSDIYNIMRALRRDIIEPLSAAKNLVVSMQQLKDWGFELETPEGSLNTKLPELDIEDGSCPWPTDLTPASFDDMEQLVNRKGPEKYENTREKRHFDSPIGHDEDEYTTPSAQDEASILLSQILLYYVCREAAATTEVVAEHNWTDHNTTEYPWFSRAKTKSRWFVEWQRICLAKEWQPYEKALINFAPGHPHVLANVFQKTALEPGKITVPELLAVVLLAATRTTIEMYKHLEVFPIVAISMSGRYFRIVQGQFNFRKKEYRVCVSKTLDFNKGVSQSPLELNTFLRWLFCDPTEIKAGDDAGEMAGLSIS